MIKLPFNLPAGRDFDVIGFGTNAVDHLIPVAEYPAFGSKITFDSHAIEPGGEVASTLVGLQRLGSRTAYVGRFGDDAAGDIGLASLSDAGVDVRWAEVVEGAETQTAFIIIDASTGERTILWRRDERLSYDPGEADRSLATRGAILHLTPHDTGAAIELAAAARQAGTIVSLDVDNVFERIDALLPLVDICICSEEFPEKMFGANGAEAGLDALQAAFKNPFAAITLGKQGSLARCNGELIRTDGFGVPGGCVDTTGAGDAFRTGFLYGVLESAAVEECLLLANAVAALKCRYPGARKGLPTIAEVQTLLKKV